MTTVLKAAQQLQQPGRRGLRPAVRAGRAKLRSALWPVIAGVVAAAAVALTLWWSPHEWPRHEWPRHEWQRHERPRHESPDTASRRDAALSAAPDHAPEREELRAPAAAEAPQRIEAKPAAAPPIAAAPPRARPDDLSGQQSRPPRAGEEQAATGPRSISAEQPLHIRSIRYAEDPAGRAVTLAAGSGTVTLHEGESANGLEVQLILPTMVYVRQGATVFAVAAETGAARGAPR